MAKEFTQSAYVEKGDSELPVADLGYSKINFGEQRMGLGLSKDQSKDYVDPGSEGATAVDLQVGNGGFSSKTGGPVTGE